MSPNGRRAWRRAAKKLRRKMGRKWQCSTDDRRHIKGAWFKRHGFTEQGLQKLDSPHPVRVYIGLWGTANGNGVEYAAVPKPFTARSLVGMTMGARKRATWWDVFHTDDGRVITESLNASEEMLQSVVRSELAKYRIGERLRPCPGCLRCRSCSGCEVLEFEGERCARCGKECPSEPTQCDGSGVLPARRSK